MKIFFIRNVPNNIPWSLKMFPVMYVTIFPRKTMKNSCFFMYVDYCRASYSKCMHCSSFAPTQWDHFFGGGRAVDLLQFALYYSETLLVSSYGPGKKYIQAFQRNSVAKVIPVKTGQFCFLNPLLYVALGAFTERAPHMMSWIYSEMKCTMILDWRHEGAPKIL